MESPTRSSERGVMTASVGDITDDYEVDSDEEKDGESAPVPVKSAICLLPSYGLCTLLSSSFSQRPSCNALETSNQKSEHLYHFFASCSLAP